VSEKKALRAKDPRDRYPANLRLSPTDMIGLFVSSEASERQVSTLSKRYSDKDHPLEKTPAARVALRTSDKVYTTSATVFVQYSKLDIRLLAKPGPR
jgi:hypothetical protein